MPIPTALQKLSLEVLETITENKLHQFEPAKRLALYESLRLESQNSNYTLAWLAVLTAQKTLPVFQRGLAEELLPEQLVENAIYCIHHPLNLKKAFSIAESGQEKAGRQWGRKEEEVPFNAYLAGIAASRSLYEVMYYCTTDDLWTDQVYTEEIAVLSDERYNDEDLAQFGGDTASAAAVAYACNDYSPYCDPDKLLEFWEWWLTEAIPQAWELAQQTEKKDK